MDQISSTGVGLCFSAKKEQEKQWEGQILILTTPSRTPRYRSDYS